MKFFVASFRLFAAFFLAMSLSFLISVSALATKADPVPTPPGGGAGTSILPEDQGSPASLELPLDRVGIPPEPPRETKSRADGPRSRQHGDIGGDDLIILSGEVLNKGSLDIATNGDLYLAVGFLDEVHGSEIRVFRSQNAGTLWELWGTISDAHSNIQYFTPSLHIVEGDHNRCFVAFARSINDRYTIGVTGSDLSLATGDFSIDVPVMSDPTRDFLVPHLSSDSNSYNYWYLYLVGQRLDPDGADIWFARSVDYGASFEPAYEIATLVGNDRDYDDPTVCYGNGEYVHVAWHLESRNQSFDQAIRYRRASSFADGGLASWEPVLSLTSHGDQMWDREPVVAASLFSDQVLIGYERIDSSHYVQEPGLLVSSDRGANFTQNIIIPGGASFVDGLEQQISTGDWILAGYDDSFGIKRAGESDLGNWAPFTTLGDAPYLISKFGNGSLALNPAMDDQVAMAWNFWTTGQIDTLMFDAEWRGGPGYPNLEPGFPLDLPHEPISPPALVDLNGDGFQEIVFGDAGGNIQVLQHDGTSLSGWPVNPGVPLSHGPVAIGTLNGHELFVVAGTAFGTVYAYHAVGELAVGWPFDTGGGGPAFVSIGAVGGPYPRSVIVRAGDRTQFLSFHGALLPTGYPTIWTPGSMAEAPAAIGDIDGDGISEIVYSISQGVYATNLHSDTQIMGRVLPSDVSDAVTLGDFDLDGDVEIVVPTSNGSLYVLNDDGSDYPGVWPFTSFTGSALTSAALANCLGNVEPEIAVAARNWHVHLLYQNGDQQGGYPVPIEGGGFFDMPIMGYLDDYFSSDIIIGGQGPHLWAWNNFGGTVPGWPKFVGHDVYQSGAMGDIDLDGRSEIVYLTTNRLIILDVNQMPAAPVDSWPMYGHDPQRTGCADCPEDLVTEVVADESIVTRVHFAGPSPNPIAGSTVFSFAVPVRAQVKLDVFDLRGRRITSILKDEVIAGRHTVGWNGRDRQGRPLASGQYLARLKVRGPGVNQQMTRKISFIR